MVASDTSHAGNAGAAAATAMKARAPNRFARDHMSALPLGITVVAPGHRISPRCGLDEQPVGTENEHERHHRIDDEQFELRDEVNGGGATDADDERADQRAFDRAHAADGDHGESEDDHLDADAERDRNLRSHDGAAECAQHRSDDEGDGVDHGDVDAERGRRLAVEDYHGEETAGSGVCFNAQ